MNKIIEEYNTFINTVKYFKMKLYHVWKVKIVIIDPFKMLKTAQLVITVVILYVNSLQMQDEPHIHMYKAKMQCYSYKIFELYRPRMLLYIKLKQLVVMIINQGNKFQ